MNRARGFQLLILILGGGFLFGLAWIFAFQFQGGGAYPRGSSLRADLDGSMILYESLRKQPGIEVRRNFEAFNRLEADPTETVVLILRPFFWSLRDPDLRDFVRAGGRVVVTPAWSQVRMEHEADSEGGDGEDLDQDPEAETDELTELLPVGESPAAQASAFPPEGKEWTTARRILNDEAAPDGISWREGAVFNEVEGEVVYTLNDEPVVVRLADGKGEWIQLADAALLQNGAQYLHRETSWVVWLLGNRGTVLFDEYHFGIQRPRGIMTLIRDAGLDVFIWALILPLGLALWRASRPLLPAVPEDQLPDAEPLSRLDGYRDLLARHLPPAVLLSHVLREWRQDHPSRSLEQMQETLEQAEQLVQAPLPRKNRLSVLQDRFRQLAAILTPHNRTRP